MATPDAVGGRDRKAVLVTRHTRLEELIAHYHTAAQARFYIENLGADFQDYEREHLTYRAARGLVEDALGRHCRLQLLDRAFLPSYLFAPDDLVFALGQDGLVANTLKYLDGQPLVGINPDPRRFDGVLLPFRPDELAALVPELLADRRPSREVTMAMARLSNGQTMYAVNDLFIGPKSHTSARYEIQLGERREVQSSSGLIVATGLGSTAWLRSIVTGASGIAAAFGVHTPVLAPGSYNPLPWNTDSLRFAVREPFPSVATQAGLVYGEITATYPLELRSLMPEGGVIFSDGLESDFLNFNSGLSATISIADRRNRLVQ